MTRVCDHCGAALPPRWPSHVRKRMFCSKSCSAKARTGARNARYNGGLCVQKDGRAKIMARDGTQVFFYRAVMEAHLGRHLTTEELVHHKNGAPGDDRLENLELTTRAEHIGTHRHKLLAAQGRTSRV